MSFLISRRFCVNCREVGRRTLASRPLYLVMTMRLTKQNTGQEIRRQIHSVRDSAAIDLMAGRSFANLSSGTGCCYLLSDGGCCGNRTGAVRGDA